MHPAPTSFPLVPLLAALVAPFTLGGALAAPDDEAVRAALADPAAAGLARPTSGQIEWADQELEMFLCLDPCTWQGLEYDDGRTPLDRIVLPQLDTDQWCEAARAFGAKQIIHVLKHTGFCWWQTDTTPYGIKNTKVRDGQADLGLLLSASCRKYGLKYGTYLSGADRHWGAAVGSGGRTSDPQRQAAYDQAFRQQMTESLTRFGEVSEIWFDGGCKIEVGDILKKRAPNAMVFGGPYATLRWPGTESGKLPYPCWSTIGNGVNADGEGAGSPDGERWCPPECDTVLYGRGGHHWFWSPNNEMKRHSVEDLMDIYLKSVGRGGVLLLNATPNTDGLIPEGDLKAYREFGAEIRRRFGSPLARTDGTGETVELDLGGLRKVNQTWIKEDLRGGHRIRAYALEGREADGSWVPLGGGISVGHKKIDVFPTALVDRIRLRVTQHTGTPIIQDLAAFFAEGVAAEARSLVQGRPTTASSTHSAGYKPEFATDGDPNTRWGSADHDITAWLEVDLGHPTDIGEVRIRELADRIREFVLECRDDSSAPWKPAFTGGPAGANFARSFPRVTARFVRLRVVKGGNLGPTIWEFGLYPGQDEGRPCGSWAAGAEEAKLDLTPHISQPATYQVMVPPGAGIRAALLRFNGVEMPPDDCRIDGNQVIVRQTQQVTEQTRTELVLRFAPGTPAGQARIRLASEK